MTNQDLKDEELSRIEQKLDMIIDFFNIRPSQVPNRSRMELREFAKATILQMKQREAKKNGNKKTRG